MESLQPNTGDSNLWTCTYFCEIQVGIYKYKWLLSNEILPLHVIAKWIDYSTYSKLTANTNKTKISISINITFILNIGTHSFPNLA